LPDGEPATPRLEAQRSMKPPPTLTLWAFLKNVTTPLICFVVSWYSIGRKP
jgi:hypothetical protein